MATFSRLISNQLVSHTWLWKILNQHAAQNYFQLFDSCHEFIKSLLSNITTLPSIIVCMFCLPCFPVIRDCKIWQFDEPDSEINFVNGVWSMSGKLFNEWKVSSGNWMVQSVHKLIQTSTVSAVSIQLEFRLESGRWKFRIRCKYRKRNEKRHTCVRRMPSRDLL